MRRARGRPRGAIWWVWALFFLNLLARGDGYFFLPRTVDPDVLRAIALAQTLVLLGTAAWLVGHTLAGAITEACVPGKAGVLAMAVASIGLVVALDLAQARRFADVGYATSYPALFLSVATSLVALRALWRRWPIAAVVCSACALKLYPIAAFPITAKRSDLLPIVDRALHAFRSGETIYQSFLLDNGVATPNVRFPGLIAAYLPAHLLGIDLRFTLLASEVAFFALAAWRWRSHPLFLPGCALLALFPYWHLRHELYETPFWVVLLGLILAIERGSPLALQVALFAALLAAHQWGLLLAPLLLLYAVHRTSLARAAALGAAAAALAVPIVWLFSRGDLAGFAWHTVGYYATMLDDQVARRSFPPGSLSLAPWLGAAIGASGLRAVSAGAQLALLIAAAACLAPRGPASARYNPLILPHLFALLAASLVLMIATNAVAWTYQYLLPGALLWLALMAAPRPPDASMTGPRRGDP